MPRSVLDQLDLDRQRLYAIASRLTGSPQDAEDVLQSVWIKLSTQTLHEITNPAAYLTTVVTRECLDLLRARRRRPVLLSDVDIEPAPAVSAEEETVWVDQIGRALLIVLDQLTPDQRAAYVLHDLFAVPFSDVAAVLDRSPASAKKLCSRARQRIHPIPTAQYDAETTTRAAHRDLVEAFLDASRNGNISTLLELLAPDAIRLADPTLIPAHIAPRISSATAIAEETTIFAARARVGAVVLIDGAPAIAIAPNGHLAAAILIDIANGHIRALSVLPAHKLAEHSITLTGAAPGDHTLHPQ